MSVCRISGMTAFLSIRMAVSSIASNHCGGDVERSFEEIALLAGDQGDDDRVRAWLSKSFEHRRVVDGVIALVGVEFGSGLELARLHLDLRIDHRLVRLVAIDEDRQLP